MNIKVPALFLTLPFLALLSLGVIPATDAFAEDGKLPFDENVSAKSLPKRALIETTKGFIEIEFYREQAPVAVRNFEHLGKKRFYEGLEFHRVVKNYVVQGGDPLASGKGGPGYTLPAEFSNIRHVRGTIGMARFASPVNPERRSNGSQFYICLTKAPHLDGLYTVFARIIDGLGVASRLEKGDKILAVRFPG